MAQNGQGTSSWSKDRMIGRQMKSHEKYQVKEKENTCWGNVVKVLGSPVLQAKPKRDSKSDSQKSTDFQKLVFFGSVISRVSLRFVDPEIEEKYKYHSLERKEAAASRFFHILSVYSIISMLSALVATRDKAFVIAITIIRLFIAIKAHIFSVPTACAYICYRPKLLLFLCTMNLILPLYCHLFTDFDETSGMLSSKDIKHTIDPPFSNYSFIWYRALSFTVIPVSACHPSISPLDFCYAVVCCIIIVTAYFVPLSISTTAVPTPASYADLIIYFSFCIVVVFFLLLIKYNYDTQVRRIFYDRLESSDFNQRLATIKAYHEASKIKPPNAQPQNSLSQDTNIYSSDSDINLSRLPAPKTMPETQVHTSFMDRIRRLRKQKKSIMNIKMSKSSNGITPRVDGGRPVMLNNLPGPLTASSTMLLGPAVSHADQSIENKANITPIQEKQSQAKNGRVHLNPFRRDGSAQSLVSGNTSEGTRKNLAHTTQMHAVVHALRQVLTTLPSESAQFEELSKIIRELSSGKDLWNFDWNDMNIDPEKMQFSGWINIPAQKQESRSFAIGRKVNDNASRIHSFSVQPVTTIMENDIALVKSTLSELGVNSTINVETLTDFDAHAVFGYLQNNWLNWNFDTLHFDHLSHGNAVAIIGKMIFKQYDLYNRFDISIPVMESFVSDVQNAYGYENPYHSAAHAAEVTHSLHMLIYYMSSNSKRIQPWYFLASFFASIVHDISHPGTGSGFQISISSDLALIYSDDAVLERYHLFCAFRLLRNESSNIFSSLSTNEYFQVRKLVIRMVLATDMQEHFAIVGRLREKYRSAMTNPDANIDTALDTEEMLELVLKVADISHPSKCLWIHLRWARAITEEFYRQGDAERAAGLPVSSLMDRNNKYIAGSQYGFVSMLVSPLYRLASYVIPKAKDVRTQCRNNREWWKKMMKKEKKGEWLDWDKEISIARQSEMNEDVAIDET